MSLLHVGQIRTHLIDGYGDAWVQELDEAHNLSRLLARWAIDLELVEANADGSAMVEITDGGDDRGIDAIAVDPTGSLVVVVQSKWRQDGSGSVDLGSVLKFINGVRGLVDLGDPDQTVGSEEIKNAAREVIRTPGGRLKMIIATTAANDLADPVREPVDQLLSVLNDVGDDNRIADFTCLTQSTLYNALSQPARPAIDLELHMLDWGRATEPVPAYYGRVNALAVAEAFQEHGSSLFADNLRVVLPKSDINEGILRTLRETPDKFWYFNNGITILAERIDRSVGGSAARDAGYFNARSASIVNGAQTVSTLGRALVAGEQASLEQAYVAVRCIEVAPDAPDFARLITRYANTQNVVSSQDFVFLDEEQHRLVKELRLLGYEYLLRSGEVASTKDLDKIIEVRQAAVALACASPTLGHAVTAKREVSRLFERERNGPYPALFNPTVNGLLVHRAVAVVRAVDARLGEEAGLNEGLRSGVAVHSNRVIAWVILNRIGRQNLLAPNFDFDAAAVTVPAEAIELLDEFVSEFPPNSYPGNVFKNQERCTELLAAAPSAAELVR